jgi:hypothetical protein
MSTGPISTRIGRFLSRLLPGKSTDRQPPKNRPSEPSLWGRPLLDLLSPDQLAMVHQLKALRCHQALSEIYTGLQSDLLNPSRRAQRLAQDRAPKP